ncbi:hypothetical protein [Pelagicoccus sp. SDUM812002]|uniref:hypothetical protein n=1 Tax=Pelagicoccus sp. SDUM812002 TaxID=3041266 RepID=UPI00280E2D02|nr:hypothetical protein [Pelagicoccus sp. SDUM812002]MDQ8188509.1 hypothetical protein [Pelagicoccus sp. SDUM812002]
MSDNNSISVPSFDEYSFTDFMKDFDDLSAHLNTLHPATNFSLKSIVYDFVTERYATNEEHVNKGSVLGSCTDFLRMNSHRFDEGKIAVAGDEGSLVSVQLIAAVYELIGATALGRSAKIPTIEKIKEKAESY